MLAQEADILKMHSTAVPVAERVLVFAPHPDDEIFGCGGLLTLLREQGAAVTVVIVTDGAAGGANADATLVAQRAAESRAAAQVLGLPEPIFWGSPDRGLTCDENLITRLTETILSKNADLVLLPSPTELHPDHQSLSFAGIEALRRLARGRRAVFYEINAPLPCPDLFIDISAVAEKKQAAMLCFGSQLQEQPYVMRIEGLNRYRSFFLGAQVTSAEAFVMLDSGSLTGELAELFDGPLARRRRMGFAVGAEDLMLPRKNPQATGWERLQEFYGRIRKIMKSC